MIILTLNKFIESEKDSKIRCIYRMVKERIMTNETEAYKCIMKDMIEDRLRMKNIYIKMFRSDLADIEQYEADVISKLMEKF